MLRIAGHFRTIERKAGDIREYLARTPLHRELHRKETTYPLLRRTGGLKEVYKETLKFPNQEMLNWISDEAFTNFDEPWSQALHSQKNREEDLGAAIVPDTQVMRDFKAADMTSLRQTRLVPADKFPFAIELSLYGKNHVAVMPLRRKSACSSRARRYIRHSRVSSR